MRRWVAPLVGVAAALSIAGGLWCLGRAGWLLWGGSPYRGPDWNPCLTLERRLGSMPEAIFDGLNARCTMRQAAALAFGAGGLAALACGGVVGARLSGGRPRQRRCGKDQGVSTKDEARPRADA